MLKLLNYDLKAIFKYWWIGAVISVMAAITDGFASAVLYSERQLPEIVTFLAILALMLALFSFGAFFLLTMVLIFIRFFKNFFTDEGYLTFTLPVSRRELLNAKVIAGVVALTATGLMLVLNCIIIFVISNNSYLFTADFLNDIKDFYNEVVIGLGIYFFIYLGELFILAVVCFLFANLFLYCCITFGSVIVKKGKLFAAIGIYYGANTIFTSLWQTFYLFGSLSLYNWAMLIPEALAKPAVALLLLCLICFVGMFCGILYALQYWMLERKLNLN